MAKKIGVGTLAAVLASVLFVWISTFSWLPAWIREDSRNWSAIVQIRVIDILRINENLSQSPGARTGPTGSSHQSRRARTLRIREGILCLRSQPRFCVSHCSEHTRLAKIVLCEHFPHAHHSEECVA